MYVDNSAPAGFGGGIRLDNFVPTTTTQMLYYNGTNLMFNGSVVSGSGMTNPMTTIGDTIYASNTASPATPARLAGVAYGALVSLSTKVPSWATPVANSVLYQSTATTTPIMSATPTLGGLTLNAATLSTIASTASIPSITIPLGSASYTGAAAGTLWNDLTRQALMTNLGASGQTQQPIALIGTLATIKTSAAVTLTTAGTYYSLLVTGNMQPGAITLPINWWTVGKTVDIELMGTVLTTGAGTFSIQPWFQGYSLGTATSAAALTTTTYVVFIKARITCQATGAAATAKFNTTVTSTIATTAGVQIGPAMVAVQLAANVSTTAAGLLDLKFTENTGASATFTVFSGSITAR